MINHTPGLFSSRSESYGNQGRSTWWKLGRKTLLSEIPPDSSDWFYPLSHWSDHCRGAEKAECCLMSRLRLCLKPCQRWSWAMSRSSCDRASPFLPLLLQPQRQPPHCRADLLRCMRGGTWHSCLRTLHRCETLALLRWCLSTKLSFWNITCRVLLGVLTQRKTSAQRLRRNSGGKKAFLQYFKKSQASRVSSAWRQMGKIKPN